MTLRKLIESTTGASSPSWTIRWIIFIAGWWRSLPRAMPTPWVNILTLRLPLATRTARGMSASGARRHRAAGMRSAWGSRVLALLLALTLVAGAPFDALAQTPHRKKKRTGKPKAVPCRSGCGPKTSAPEITSATPEDEASQRELSSLARALHNATPGSYEELAAFAGKNASDAGGP